MLSSGTPIAAPRSHTVAPVQPQRTQRPQLGTTERAPSELILIIDENPKNAALMDKLLRTRFRTQVANRGILGLQMALAKEQPDLILLAARMSQPDGYAICEMLQSNPRTRPIPVMFQASTRGREADERAWERGMSLGAVGYIFKPITSEALLEKVSQFFSSFGWMMAERKIALAS